jgi:predicted metalloprotease
MHNLRFRRVLWGVVLAVLPVMISASCGRASSSDSDIVIDEGKTCRFNLVHRPRTQDHRSQEEDWNGIKKDIGKAEGYVDGFWRRHWGECFGDIPYRAPTSKDVYTRDSPVTCGGEVLSADGAFYCRPGKFVAYGSDLMHRAVDEGDALAYLVVAHEWGHAIQDLLRTTEFRSYVAEREELQADCLAGAALWGSDYEGYFEWQLGDSTEAADALKSIADETEWTKRTPSGPVAHGDALQRIAAFERGRSRAGVTDCFDMGLSDSETTEAPTPTEDPPSEDPAPTTEATATPRPGEIDARGHELTGWASPSGNILCGAHSAGGEEGATVRCDIVKHKWPSPPRPQSCAPEDWGYSVKFTEEGAAFACVGDPATSAKPDAVDTWWWKQGDLTTDAGLAALPYGASVRVSDALVCLSEEGGMTCRDDQSEHGFILAREVKNLW